MDREKLIKVITNGNWSTAEQLADRILAFECILSGGIIKCESKEMDKPELPEELGGISSNKECKKAVNQIICYLRAKEAGNGQ